MIPILLIHGFPLDGRMWAQQADHLRAQRRTVLTPDLPGFGLTPTVPAPPRDRASIDFYADAIHEIIQAQPGVEGKKQAIVGGFSLGGYILLALLREHPEDVAAAMFIDTRADADTPEVRATRLKSIDDMEKNGTATLIETLSGRLFAKRTAPAIRQAARAIMQDQASAAVIAAQSSMARRRDHSDLLPDLQLPVLIVVGAEDVITPPSVALAMQSHMPHAMVVQIVGAGHMSPVEQPGAVNGALDAFLTPVGEAAG